MKRLGLILKAVIGRRWALPTIAVVAGMIFLGRLGFWQLDRLEQRRTANAALAASLAAVPLALPDDLIPDDVEILKNRDVLVRGIFDFEHEGQLILQNWQGQSGVSLLTPLLIEGTETAVLINRGWIPEAEIENQSQYQQNGVVTIDGYIGLTQTLSREGVENAKPVRGEGEWYRVDIVAYDDILPYDLYPFYIIQSPNAEIEEELPIHQAKDVDLSEGSHLSYAFQWFTFSGMLGIIYLIYVNKSLHEK